jgi:hypothetical protein
VLGAWQSGIGIQPHPHTPTKCAIVPGDPAKATRGGLLLAGGLLLLPGCFLVVASLRFFGGRPVFRFVVFSGDFVCVCVFSIFKQCAGSHWEPTMSARPRPAVCCRCALRCCCASCLSPSWWLVLVLGVLCVYSMSLLLLIAVPAVEVSGTRIRGLEINATKSRTRLFKRRA